MDAEACFFEAVIVPHRSLSKRGLWVLIAAIGVLSTVTTTVFWLLGAWPVAVFNGAEITAAALLLRYNARAARASEVILLSPAALRVIRTGQDGRRTERTLPPGWMRVVLEDRPGRVPGLFLVAARERLEVGASLGEAEKLSLTEALRTALEDWRAPLLGDAPLP